MLSKGNGLLIKENIWTLKNKTIEEGTNLTKISIENVVASATIAEELNIETISMLLDDAEYEPKQFPGVIYRLKEPRVATLIFRSGKVVCTGAKSIDSVRKAFELLTQQLKDAGISVVKNPEVIIQNMVATWDTGQALDLTAITLSFGLERVEYEPEQFPGLVFRLSDPKVVMLFFKSGKVVCTGAKSIEDLERAVDIVGKELKASGFLS
jgi:transcription initiation factor TFIID TATA-box-binding protein